MGRSFMLPPGTPHDRVKALRQAFTQTMSDPAFIADAKKRKMELEPMTGEAIQAVIEKAVSTPSPLIARALEAVN